MREKNIRKNIGFEGRGRRKIKNGGSEKWRERPNEL